MPSPKSQNTRGDSIPCDEVHAAYYPLKLVHDRYCQSKGKGKFLRNHDSGIILFESAAFKLKKMEVVAVHREYEERTGRTHRKEGCAACRMPDCQE